MRTRLLCELSKFVLFFSLLLAFPYASFIGYRHWQDAEPEIHLILSEQDSMPLEIEVGIKCRGAKEFKISNFPTFPGARWRKMSNKILWRLDDKADIASVWVTFKRKNPQTSKYEISKPIAYAIDRKKTFKKIVRHFGGYVDWTEGRIVIEAQGEKEKDGKARYDLSETQRIAEKELYKSSYEILKAIPLTHYYTIENFLELNATTSVTGMSGVDINMFLKSVTLKEIKHSDANTLILIGELTFYASKDNPGLGITMKELTPLRSLSLSNNLSTVFDGMILDVRNWDYSLAMYPDIISDNDEEVISTVYYTNAQSVYARYLRYAEMSYIKKNISNEKNQFLPNILYVRAIGIDQNNRSKVIITDRYKRLIQSNPETVYNICNGNMFLIVD